MLSGKIHEILTAGLPLRRAVWHGDTTEGRYFTVCLLECFEFCIANTY